MDWFGLAGGGGSSLGGDVQLSATIGEPAAGQMGGGDFVIIGGFWSVPVEEPGQPSLTISLAGGNVIITWPESGSDNFGLAETGALGPPWAPLNETPQSSNGTKTVRLPLTPGNHFYRLQKP